MDMVREWRKEIAKLDMDWLRGSLVDVLQTSVRPVLPVALQDTSVQLLGKSN
jgi:hypothetical protein